MSVFVAADERATTFSGLPEFPGENPDVLLIKEWIDKASDQVVAGGLSALVRGGIPPELAKLKPKRHIVAQHGATDATVTAVAAKNLEIDVQNMENKAELDDKLDEYSTRFGAAIAKCMRKNAPNRLKNMQRKAQKKTTGGDDIENCYDGVVMWKDLLALGTGDVRESDVKKHQQEIERLRDTPLRDNATATDWDNRITEYEGHHRFVEMPNEGKRLSLVYLGMMPKNLQQSKMSLKEPLLAQDLPTDTHKKV